MMTEEIIILTMMIIRVMILEATTVMMEGTITIEGINMEGIVSSYANNRKEVIVHRSLPHYLEENISKWQNQQQRKLPLDEALSSSGTVP